MVFRKLGRAVKAGTQPSQAPSRPGGDVDDSELDFYVVAQTSDVAPGELKYVEVGPDYEPIVLINFEGDFYALGDLCTHEEASLSDGELQGDERAQFDKSVGAVRGLLEACRNIDASLA